MEDRKWRKFGATGLAVSAKVIADVASGQGVVVQTVRDSGTGELLQNESFDLADVKANGLPLWNPLEIAKKK